MTYSTTATRTIATTTTEARVRYVMGKVMANFQALVAADFLTPARADAWQADLIALQLIDALASFQIQFAAKSAAPYCVNYDVSSDGSIQADAASGGLDMYGIPAGTPVTLCVRLRTDKYAAGRALLEQRGWTFNGKLIDAADSELRSFSTGGYGITRSKRGTWP